MVFTLLQPDYDCTNAAVRALFEDSAFEELYKGHYRENPGPFRRAIENARRITPDKDEDEIETYVQSNLIPTLTKEVTVSFGEVLKGFYDVHAHQFVSGDFADISYSLSHNPDPRFPVECRITALLCNPALKLSMAEIMSGRAGTTAEAIVRVLTTEYGLQDAIALRIAEAYRKVFSL